MDINALLSPYGRIFGTHAAEVTTEVAVGTYADAFAESGLVGTPVLEEDLVEVDLLDAPVGKHLVVEAAPDLLTDSLAAFEEIAAFDQIDAFDPADLATVDAPGDVWGKHRADVPVDSMTHLVPVVATHRLSA
jgi:hypothetical protein